MSAKPISIRRFLTALVIASFLIPVRAGAIEVHKKLQPMGGGGPAEGGGAAPASNPIPKAMQQQLADTVASESDNFLNEESEKKASGKPYVDLEHAKFMYIPAQKEGKWSVQAKLEAPEYSPNKSDPAAKGKPTGNRKVLIFNYRLDGSKWTETEQPKWEDVQQTASAKKPK